MKLLLGIQCINILIIIICIVTATRNFKNIIEARILLLLPILSFLQIVITELINTFFYHQNHLKAISKTSIDTYTFIEFIVIVIFYNHILRYQKIKKVNRMILLLASLFYFTYLFSYKNIYALMDYFVLLSGLWIEILVLIHLLYTIKNYDLNILFKNSNNIISLGVFLSYIIIWPINVMQDLYLNNISAYIEFIFMSNSLGYFILFSSLTISFYVSGKPRGN